MHDGQAVAVVGAEVRKFNGFVAERYGFAVSECFIRGDRLGIFLEPTDTIFLGNNRGTGVFENLTAGSMVAMFVAVDHVFDRLVADRAYCRHQLGCGTLIDRISDDDTLIGGDKHRAVATKAERINRNSRLFT